MYTTGQTCAIATITLASSSMVSPIRKDAPSESPKSLQRKGIMRRSDPIGGEEKNNGVVGSIIIIVIPYHTTDMTLDSPLRGVIRNPQVVTHRSLFLIQVVVLSGRRLLFYSCQQSIPCLLVEGDPTLHPRTAKRLFLFGYLGYSLLETSYG